MPERVKPVCCVIMILCVLLFASCGKDSQDTAFAGDEDPVLSEENLDVRPEDLENITEPEISDDIGEASNEKDDIQSAGDEGEGDEPKPDFNFPVQGVRPYAVMIDNEGTVPLPQGGLDKAQLIYEAVAEGGTTRLMAVFWNANPEMIGPVRSARHYFIDYAMEHDAIYIHFGWSPMAKNDIARFKINNANGVSNGWEIFWDLTNNPNNWQDSYTSMEKILAYVDKAGYSKTTDKPLVFEYNETDREIEGGKDAKKIFIKYSYYTCDYEYDEENKVYWRNRDGKPHMERVSGEQLAAKNIIIQRVNNYTIKGDTEGRQNLDNVGSGTGIYITCGKMTEISWYKESRTAPTIYRDSSGNKIVLNPGQTWIQITPLYAEVNIE